MDTNPIANLTPHYTNEFYREARTVWIEQGYKADGAYGTIKGVSYDYSDRIWQWDWNKADAARLAVDASIDRRSPAFIQAFLRGYFGKPELKLVHVMAGFNLSNGYSYQVYGYILSE